MLVPGLACLPYCNMLHHQKGELCSTAAKPALVPTPSLCMVLIQHVAVWQAEKRCS